MKISINVNQTCAVTLTQSGADLYNRKTDPMHKRVAGDVWHAPLWEIMSVFGAYLHVGAPLFFVENEVHIVTSTS